MVWLVWIAWPSFFIALIIGIILFIKSKHFYPVIYVASVWLYIFTAGFLIDAYTLGRFGILTVMIISAIVFMALGYYFSKIISK